MKFIEEPLTHFLVLGALIFFANGYLSTNSETQGDGRDIKIDRATLVEFMQYRSKIFKPELFEKNFEQMPLAKKQEIAELFLRDEMLYRESKALGLQEGDYVIRQRLIQKQNYLIEDLVPSEANDETLRNYMNDNAARYRVPASVKFTHIFFSESERGRKQAEKAAINVGKRLKENPISFDDAGSYGDKFPYFKNYVERTKDYVSSHFGNASAAEIFAHSASDNSWFGPIKSSYGYHLVMLVDKKNDRMAALDEIRGRVLDDWRDDERRKTKELFFKLLKEKYNVTMELN